MRAIFLSLMITLILGMLVLWGGQSKFLQTYPFEGSLTPETPAKIITTENITALQKLNDLTFPETLTSVAWANQDTMVAVSLLNGEIYLYSLSNETFVTVLSGDYDENEYITSLRFSDDDILLAVGSTTGKVSIWNLKKEVIIQTVQLVDEYLFVGKSVKDIAFSHDNKTVKFVSVGGVFQEHKIDNGELIKSLSLQADDLRFTTPSILLSPDGTKIATVSIDGSVEVWDTENESMDFRFSEHTGDVWALNFSNNQQFLASGSDDNSIVIWDLDTDKQSNIWTDHNDFVRIVLFNPDDTMLVSMSLDDMMCFWDIAEDKKIYCRKHPFSYMRFNKQGTILLMSNREGIEFWYLP